MQSSFVWPLRVYYENTDAGGVVYHSMYLNFMERARTEWLRHYGFDHQSNATQLGVMFVVRNLQISYQKPAKLDDQLEVHCSIQSLGRASLQFRQSILRAGETLTDATVDLVCVDVDTFKPVAVPPNMRAIFTQFLSLPQPSQPVPEPA